MTPLEFHFFDKNPDGSRSWLKTWPDEVDFAQAKSQMKKLVAQLPPPAPGDMEAQVNLKKSSVPFGIGTGGYTGEAWLALDRITAHWALLYWERSYDSEPAEFATQSLSDACNFYLAALRFWDGTSSMMDVNPDDPKDYRHVYDHAYTSYPGSTRYSYKVPEFFSSIQKQLAERGICNAIVTKDDELLGPLVKLVHNNGKLCLTHKWLGNTCWFQTPRYAISAFILANTKTMAFQPDDKSILAMAG
ncbi:MAG: hypothetical protein COA52_16765 [Hyphomicrobiales bacterium]|nr:MAG: hypothetical protein COA52_16765 [Hyphomicrobiales bacterium]